MSTIQKSSARHRVVCLDRLARAIHAPSDRHQAWLDILITWGYPEVRSAVYAEWDAVVAWLRAADVGQYPDYVDREMLVWMLRELKRYPRVVYSPRT